MQRFKTKIRKIGNSSGVILPADVIGKLNLKTNEIEISIEEGSLIITPIPLTLTELLDTVPEGEKFLEVDAGREGAEKL